MANLALATLSLVLSMMAVCFSVAVAMGWV